MTGQQFEARLTKPDTVGAWTYLVVPFNVEQVWGGRSRVAVIAEIDGIAVQSSLMPQGDDKHILVVNKTIQERIGKKAGDTVHVKVTRDMGVRTLSIPEDFQQALTAEPEAGALFNNMSYSHRKEYIDWIESAKKRETRINRIHKAIRMIGDKQKLKG